MVGGYNRKKSQRHGDQVRRKIRVPRALIKRKKK